MLLRIKKSVQFAHTVAAIRTPKPLVFTTCVAIILFLQIANAQIDLNSPILAVLSEERVKQDMRTCVYTLGESEIIVQIAGEGHCPETFSF